MSQACQFMSIRPKHNHVNRRKTPGLLDEGRNHSYTWALCRTCKRKYEGFHPRWDNEHSMMALPTFFFVIDSSERSASARPLEIGWRKSSLSLSEKNKNNNNNNNKRHREPETRKLRNTPVCHLSANLILHDEFQIEVDSTDWIKILTGSITLFWRQKASFTIGSKSSICPRE